MIHKKYKKQGYAYMNKGGFLLKGSKPKEYDVICYMDKFGDVAVLRSDGRIYVKTNKGPEKVAAILKNESYLSADDWRRLMTGKIDMAAATGSLYFEHNSQPVFLMQVPTILRDTLNIQQGMIRDVRDHRASRTRYDYYDVPFITRCNYRAACAFSTQLQNQFISVHDRTLDMEMIREFVGYAGYIPKLFDTRILHSGEEYVNHKINPVIRIDLEQNHTLVYDDTNVLLGKGWLRENKYRGKAPVVPNIIPKRGNALGKPKGIILHGVKQHSRVLACIFWVGAVTSFSKYDQNGVCYMLNLGSYMINVCNLSEDLEVLRSNVPGLLVFS